MAILAAANCLFLVVALNGVVDPVDLAALLAVKTSCLVVAFVTLSAVELSVLERELRVAAIGAAALLLLLTLRDQVLELRISGQVLRGVATVVSHF